MDVGKAIRISLRASKMAIASSAFRCLDSFKARVRNETQGIAEKQFSAAVAALQEVGTLSGLRIERIEYIACESELCTA
jgi:hypothetical protein